MSSWGKRAAIYNALELVRYSIMTAIVIVITITFVGLFVTQKSDTRNAELSVYDQLLIYGRDGIQAIEPHTGRSIPLTVDTTRFNDATLDAALSHPDNKFVGARLLLTDLQDGSSATAYWNRKWYDIYKPLASKSGPGAAIVRVTHHDVIIWSPKGKHHGTLSIEMVTPAR